MSSPSVKLQRLRGIFVAYFVLKSAVGAVFAAGFIRPLVEERAGLRGWSPATLAFFGLAVSAVILLVAWLVFGEMVRRRNWARVLLLVVGWLTVAGAVFSLLTSPQVSEMTAWLTRLVPEMDLDWEKLMQFDRVQKVFELLFWGYLISVLQFDPEVRREFCPAEAKGGEQSPS